jgi:hypothetical protein
MTYDLRRTNGLIAKTVHTHLYQARPTTALYTAMFLNPRP